MRPSIWAFAAWAGVGIVCAIAVVTPFTIGPLAAVVAAAGGGALLAWRGSRNASATGLLTGPGLIALYIGYLNRGGPGMVCTTTRNAGECIQEWNPWPLLAVGVMLVAASIGLFLWLRGRGTAARR
jgi:hypothetical protein